MAKKIEEKMDKEMKRWRISIKNPLESTYT